MTEQVKINPDLLIILVGAVINKSVLNYTGDYADNKASVPVQQFIDDLNETTFQYTTKFPNDDIHFPLIDIKLLSFIVNRTLYSKFVSVTNDLVIVEFSDQYEHYLKTIVATSTLRYSKYLLNSAKLLYDREETAKSELIKRGEANKESGPDVINDEKNVAGEGKENELVDSTTEVKEKMEDADKDSKKEEVPSTIDEKEEKGKDENKVQGEKEETMKDAQIEKETQENKEEQENEDQENEDQENEEQEQEEQEQEEQEQEEQVQEKREEEGEEEQQEKEQQEEEQEKEEQEKSEEQETEELEKKEIEQEDSKELAQKEKKEIEQEDTKDESRNMLQEKTTEEKIDKEPVLNDDILQSPMEQSSNVSDPVNIKEIASPEVEDLIPPTRLETNTKEQVDELKDTVSVDKQDDGHLEDDQVLESVKDDEKLADENLKEENNTLLVSEIEDKTVDNKDDLHEQLRQDLEETKLNNSAEEPTTEAEDATHAQPQSQPQSQDPSKEDKEQSHDSVGADADAKEIRTDDELISRKDEVTKKPTSEKQHGAIVETKPQLKNEPVRAQEDTRDLREIRETRKRPRSHSPGAPLQHHKKFQSIAISLLNSIQEHRFSSPFLHAVNAKDAPNYYEIIHQPKDLKSILKALKSKADPPVYQLVVELERDIMLMFANCVMYNRLDEDLVGLTRTMKEEVGELFKMFKEAELEIR